MAKKLRLIFIATCLLLSYTTDTQAQNKNDIVGVWQTRGDNGNEAESDIKIWNDNGEYKAKIIKVYDTESQNNRCSKCDKDDPRYNQKILGMTILYKMKKTGENEWANGKILDPESGSIYDCKMWLEGGKLVIRGYIGFSLLGRSQKWIRLE